MQLSGWIGKNVRRAVDGFVSSNHVAWRTYMRLHRSWPRELYPPRPTPRKACPDEQQLAISMVLPGTGWADRLHGMLSLWGLCREHGWRFGIWFKAPFVLEDYLLPVDYDWRLTQDRLDFEHAAPIECRWIGARYGKCDIERCIRRHAITHVYTNYPFYWDDYPRLYRELFRPAPALEALIEQNTAAIGGEYVAAVFRFQELLGDFHEGGGFRTLPEGRQREVLIRKCLEQLERVRAENPGVKRVLVTCDSPTFLQRVAAAFDWVYTIPGRVTHMGYSTGIPTENSLKSFVDFYMIMRARKVYRIRGGGMYHSGFPWIAAQVGNVPFIDRKF